MTTHSTYNPDVIAAIATPRGNAAIAVIRVSGEGAIALCDGVFAPKAGAPLASRKGWTCALGEIRDGDETVDTVVATVYRAPKSYTGEDCVEFACHGGVFVTERVLETLLKAGARQARGGEFSKRAFLNGRLGLTEAESVMSVVSARSAEALKLANRQAGGALDRGLRELRDAANEILIHISAEADFPEEDIPELPRGEAVDKLFDLSDRCLKLAGTYEGGLALTEGVDAVIAGRANVGKSTLMNLLAGRERSIVSDVPGTTRDVVESAVVCGGVLLKLADTAGLRDAPEEIERRGVELANARLDAASLVIAVFDGSEELKDEDFSLLKRAPQIAVINKCDKPRGMDISPIEDECAFVVEMCAKTGEGLDALAEAVRAVTGADDFDDADWWCASLHQRDCLRKAGEGLAAAGLALKRGFEADIAAVDLREAVAALDECAGRNVADDVIDGIFSTFCVGK